MYSVLDSIMGGDPYAFFSREMGQGDGQNERVLIVDYGIPKQRGCIR
ncbi:MAG: hypothetical protein ACJAZ0_002591 [Halioglobus sp.]|jgi:hypothetical protein